METRVCEPIVLDQAVTNTHREKAVRSGKAKLETVVQAHNRSLMKRCASLFVKLLWAPAMVLLLAVCYYRLSAREVCHPVPLPLPASFSEGSRAARTFDDWSARAMQSSGNVLGRATLLQYTFVADLGPTYSKKYRDCLNSRRQKSVCKKLYLTHLYVIQPAGFVKAVMLAHVKADAKLSGSGVCELRRVSPLLQGLEVKKHIMKKHVASIDRSVSSSSAGDRYDFDQDSQVLLPLAADFADVTFELPWSCVGVTVGDRGAVLLLVAAALLAYRFYALRGEFPREAGKVDNVLFQLASDYAERFDRSWSIENVSSLILEDIGLSSQFGVLFEDDRTLLSQNWIFVIGGLKIAAAGVHIRTACDRNAHTFQREVTDALTGNTCGPLSETARTTLQHRLKHPTWKDFQVLRQVDLRLFKVSGDGSVLRIDPVTFFPELPTDADWLAMKDSAASLESLFQTEPVPAALPTLLSRESSRTSLDGKVSEECADAAPALPARSISRHRYDKCPECAITQEKAPLFALVEKQVYSWSALRRSLEDRGKTLRQGEIVACGPRDHFLLQSDPMNVIICKSEKVNVFDQEVADFIVQKHQANAGNQLLLLQHLASAMARQMQGGATEQEEEEEEEEH